MNPQRITLSNPSFAGRIKKYDTYQKRSDSARTASPKHVVRAIKQYQNSPRTVIPAVLHKQRSTSPPASAEHVTMKPHRHRPTSGMSQAQQIALQSVARARGQFGEQFVDIPTQPQATKKQMTRFQKLFYGFGITMFLLAGGVSVQTLITNLQAKEQIGVLGAVSTDEQGVAEGTGSDPAEAPVSDQALANYRVNPELPRYIRIPDIGVFARIKHTGVTSEGAVDAPANINDASWYNESARPGNKIGSSLLLGHVSGWSASGVFKKIDQLRAGQRFEIEKGSGEKLTYEVVRGERIPLEQVDMSKILATEVAGEHDIKLMTCSGRFDRETDQYAERYVVYAKILR